MGKKTIGISIAILGVLVLFSSEDNAWIVSAVFLGVGSGIFFWKE
jgi:multisubunit Na+/H+ antiporter MnhG subunit|tara:strand:- start:65 stop:199 length:135 start_codon:yes stop_codon:yes gene_type:complete